MNRVLPLLLVASLLPALAGCDDASTANKNPPVRPVLSVVVAPQAAGGTAFAGTIEPRYRADLGFRTMGRIIARDVDVGAIVTAGQRLAALDPLALELAVRSARADLATAQAQRATALATEQRQRALLADKATSAENFDAAERARAAADAAVTRADANLVKATEQLSYAELRADFDGVVTAVQGEVGQVVSAGQTIFTIARPDVREAVVDLPDELAAGLTPERRFIVTSELDSDTRVVGFPREIAPLADPQTRTRRVRLSLQDPPETFRLGTTVRAAPLDGAVLRIDLPASSLLERDGKFFVWVVNPATRAVALREVQIGARDARSFTVTEGLAPGTRVVTAGVHSLTEGQIVKLQNEPPSQ
jgi:RND family efflux transporter MFP subunit